MFQQRIRIFTSSIIALLLSVPLFGQDIQVDREELGSIGDNTVTFINYVGPSEYINTLDQIRDIGRRLGSQIDPVASNESSVAGKYRVIHSVNPDILEGLDADIFILENNASVDHIVNLRHILAGYLETTYQYSKKDAYLTAEFITYYNAVFRGNESMVRERYKPPVGAVLTPKKIGLDTHYLNWAGQTQILIPLQGNVQISKVDTGVLSGKEVIEEMRQEEDMNIEPRKDMAELREKELDKEQSELDERLEDVERQEATIVQELEELQEKETITPPEAARMDTLEDEKEALDDEKATIEKEQTRIDERTEDVMKMRDDIAEDQNSLMDENKTAKETVETVAPIASTLPVTPATPVKPVWFLTVDDDGDGIPFGRVIKYNLENGKNLAVSNLTAVRGRTLILLSDALLVIAGKTSGNARVRPMLLDRNTLDVQKEGTHDVFPGSLITVRDRDIYLVTTENDEWRMGRFNKNLERIAVSEAAVEPWTTLSFDKNSLFVQSSKGDILRLSISNLKEED